jgi:hypothetical protein
MNAALEDSREHTALLVLASSGYDGESECLVERTQDAQSAESAAGVGPHRHGWQQAEDARPVGTHGQLARRAKRLSRALVMMAVVYRCR